MLRWLLSLHELAIRYVQGVCHMGRKFSRRRNSTLILSEPIACTGKPEGAFPLPVDAVKVIPLALGQVVGDR